jgi:hypothetical protein
VRWNFLKHRCTLVQEKTASKKDKNEISQDNQKGLDESLVMDEDNIQGEESEKESNCDSKHLGIGKEEKEETDK